MSGCIQYTYTVYVWPGCILPTYKRPVYNINQLQKPFYFTNQEIKWSGKTNEMELPAHVERLNVTINYQGQIIHTYKGLCVLYNMSNTTHTHVHSGTETMTAGTQR